MDFSQFEELRLSDLKHSYVSYFEDNEDDDDFPSTKYDLISQGINYRIYLHKDTLESFYVEKEDRTEDE